MGVVIDIAALANFPEAEEKTVQYIAKAVGLKNQFPAHRYCAQSFQKVSTLAGVDVETQYHYGWRAADLVGTLEENEFFFGDCRIYFVCNNIIADYQVDISVAIPGSVASLEVATFNDLITPIFRSQIVSIDIPMVPLNYVSLRFTTTGAGEITASVFSVWNGFYFNNK